MSVEDFIYSSFGRARPYIPAKTDDHIRKPQFASQILGGLGHPESGLPMILVTGSKGKGSVSRMIAFLLEQLGYKVGHYSSPHLLDFTERIRVNGKAISEQDLERLIERAKPIVAGIHVNEQEGEYISPIAISQAIAMLYFREQKIDVAVIEAGRGGRFDDTNQLPHQVAVITAVIEEHLENLGPKIEDVVWHKLGILTREVDRAYIGKQRADVFDLMQKQLQKEQIQIPLYYDQRDFSAFNIHLSLNGTRTEIMSHHQRFPEVTIPLLGQFQADNFALAFTVVNDWTRGRAEQVNWSEFLPKLQWPGRCEVIERHPLVLLDGGIHRSSAAQVRDLLDQITYTKLHVVLSIPKDKDVEGVISVWSQVADQIITTTATNQYLNFDLEYSTILNRYTNNGIHIPDFNEAIDAARIGLNEQSVLLLMGTQSFVADVKRRWGQSVRDL